MWINLYSEALGGFANNMYWSSADVDSHNAWLQNFANADQAYFDKHEAFRIRAVRSF